MNTSSDADGKIHHAFPEAIASLSFIFKIKLRISVPCISICVLYQVRQKNIVVDCYSYLPMQFDNTCFTTHHILIVEGTYGHRARKSKKYQGYHEVPLILITMLSLFLYSNCYCCQAFTLTVLVTRYNTSDFHLIISFNSYCLILFNT